MKYIVLICMCFCLIAVCSADDNKTVNATNQTVILNQTINTTPSIIDDQIIYPYQPPYRLLNQGQKVYPNDTIDISGIGWGEGVAYYGINGAYNYPIYIIEFTNSRYSQMRFYLDPSVFSSRPGMWFQYYGNTSEPRGNLDLFYVLNAVRTETTRYPNGTLINKTIGINNNTPESLKFTLPLPEVYVSDYNLAVGDPLFIQTDGAAKVWIFGTSDYIYDYETEGNGLTIPSENISGLSPGNYDILIQKKGDNKEFDVRYNDYNIEYKTGWSGIKTTNLRGIQPRVSIGYLQDTIAKTDDIYIIKHLSIDHPSISITQMDEKAVGSREIEYKDQPGLVTLFDVRGYTNLANGTQIIAVLDKPLHKGIMPKDKAYKTNVLRTSYGNQSAYQVYVPIIWDSMSIGSHTISVESSDGAIVYSDFYVGAFNDGTPKPNATIKYADSRNPFVPTPTPQVITVIQTQEVIKERVKEIVREIPANATEIYVKQKQANDETEKERSSARIIYAIIGILIIIFAVVGYYILTVIRRV